MSASISSVGGSGRAVDDYSPYCEGDVDPTLNKRIRCLIESDTNYIVYLDDEFAVHYSTTPGFSLSKLFGEVATETRHLETMAVGRRLRPDQYLAFARLLAEAMARIIADRAAAQADKSLDNAKTYLDARSLEKARLWHVQAAGVTAIVAAFVGALLLACRSRVAATLGGDATAILIASLCGPLGGLLSILMRFKNLKVNPAAGPFIHIMEGVARIVTSTLGAFLIALGIRANLFLGFVNSLTHPLIGMLSVCLISGASERIVPSFIAQVEKSARTESHEVGRAS